MILGSFAPRRRHDSISSRAPEAKAPCRACDAELRHPTHPADERAVHDTSLERPAAVVASSDDDQRRVEPRAGENRRPPLVERAMRVPRDVGPERVDHLVQFLVVDAESERHRHDAVRARQGPGGRRCRLAVPVRSSTGSARSRARPGRPAARRPAPVTRPGRRRRARRAMRRGRGGRRRHLLRRGQPRPECGRARPPTPRRRRHHRPRRPGRQPRRSRRPAGRDRVRRERR